MKLRTLLSGLVLVASVNAEVMGDLLPYLTTYYTQVFNPNKKTVFANLANWARFYIPVLFPELKSYVHMAIATDGFIGVNDYFDFTKKERDLL